MKHIVIGMGYGDEGKGMVVDYLTRKYTRPHPMAPETLLPRVVRFGGGHQCGHRVIAGGKTHIFSNYGSGVLAGAATYWGKKCVVDPVGLVAEWKVLEKKVKYGPYIDIHPECPVVFPSDKKINHMRERMERHGSVGVGFGEAVRRDGTTDKFRAIELTACPDILAWKFRNQETGAAWSEFVRAIPIFLEIASVTKFTISKYGIIIFEGHQGVMLDMDYGLFPHVTRSQTTSRAAEYMLTPKDEIHLHLVTRAYSTRHGAGPLIGADFADRLKLHNNKDESNKNHEWQGPFRTAPFNADVFKYAWDVEEKTRKFAPHSTTLYITCMDHIATDKVPVIRNDKLEWWKKDDFKKELNLRVKVVTTHGKTWSTDKGLMSSDI